MGNQKKIGNEYEKKLCELLQRYGYWCHIFGYNSNGQPCDVIAIRGNKVYLIDVKHCNSDRFSFDRIEPNQKTSFEYANKVCGIEKVGFAVYFENSEMFYWVPYSLTQDKNLKSVVRFGLKGLESEIV